LHLNLLNMIENQKAYVLLSGGQDSFVSLLWAKKNFVEVEAVSIFYEQRHNIELQYAKAIANNFGVKHVVYDIGSFFSQLTISSLLKEGKHTESHALANQLPASFVPNRNGVFLTVIANHAFKDNINPINLVTGVCQTDYSGYPDCRDNYIKAKALELSLGLDRPVNIHTPLMWKTKAETFKMADEAGVLQEMIEHTLTCYNGDESLHEWGRGCTQCPACQLRKKGYEEFKVMKNEK